MTAKKTGKTGKTVSSRMQGARAVWVAVGILALAFLVGVLAPAWYFAGRLVENNTAVRAIGELQQQPSRMQTALNSIQDRLRARGFVRDSIEQLKRATAQFETSTSGLRTGTGVRIGGIGGDDDVQKTIEEMNAAVRQAPRSTTVRLTRGFTIIHLPPDMRDENAVTEDLRFIIDNAPGGRPEDVLHVLLGDVLAESGDLPAARAEYQQVSGASAFAAEQVKVRMADLAKGQISPASIAQVRAGTGTRCAMCHAPGVDN